MPIWGNDAEPGFGWHAFSSSAHPNQEAEALTLPDQRIRVLELGAWVGGWNGTCRIRLCAWAEDGTLLAQSAEQTIPNEGSGGEGQIARHTGALLVPYESEPGELIWVGFTRNRSDGHQIGTGSTINQHFHGRAPYPDGDFGEVELYVAQARRIGCWIEDYEPIATAHVYRSGAWTDPETVVRRSAAWGDPESVQAYRSGAWTDAD